MIASLSVVVGLLLLGVALWDAFATIVLPRTVSIILRAARLFSGMGWRLWRAAGLRCSTRRTREVLLSAFGPLSLFCLLSLWAGMILVAYALLHFGLGT